MPASYHAEFTGYAVRVWPWTTSPAEPMRGPRVLQVEWSPYDENLLALSTAQHFGIVGKGKVKLWRSVREGSHDADRAFHQQYVLRLSSKGMKPVAEVDTKDGENAVMQPWRRQWADTHTMCPRCL